MTAILENPPIGSSNTGSVRVGDSNSGPYATFAAYNDATYYPRVAITYTGGGSTGGSFFFKH